MINKDLKSVPKFNLRKILNIQDRVANILFRYEGSKLKTSDALDMITDDISEEFPVVSPDVIKVSLQPLTMGTVDRTAIETFSLRFGANWDELVSEHPILPYTGLSEPTWSVVEVQRTLPAKTRAGKVGGKFTFKVLTGHAAGETFTKVLSMKQLKMIARFIGFNKKGVKRYDGIRSSFFGLRLAVELYSISDGLDFDKYEPKRCLSYNRKLIHERFGSKCPKGYTHRCSVCQLGLDQCSRACRLTTLTIKGCPICKNEDAIFEKDFCLSCHKQSVFGAPIDQRASVSA